MANSSSYDNNFIFIMCMNYAKSLDSTTVPKATDFKEDHEATANYSSTDNERHMTKAEIRYVGRTNNF